MPEYFTAHVSIKKVTKPDLISNNTGRTMQSPAPKTERIIEDVLEVTVRAENYTKLAAKIEAIMEVED